MNNTNLIVVIMLTTLVLIGNPPEAKAYLDPGTANFVLQTAIAVFAGALISFRNKLSSLSSIFRRQMPKETIEDIEAKAKQ